MNYSKQRELILTIIQNTRSHPTAEAIFAKAQESMPSIGMATIYRNLNLLVDTGKIKRISIPNEVDRYDDARIDHDHALCIKCGKMFDVFISSDKKDALLIGEELPCDFQIKEANFMIYGYMW
ncbi:MAG: transcriptional repressor [Coriobacteriia bacterium]|nr:transcriptional repressor [Coriobacteriia bacterium]